MRYVLLLAVSVGGPALLCGCEVLRAIAGSGTAQGAVGGAADAAARGADLGEIALYAFLGWFGLRTSEAGGKAIVSRVRNGGKSV